MADGQAGAGDTGLGGDVRDRTGAAAFHEPSPSLDVQSGVRMCHRSTSVLRPAVMAVRRGNAMTSATATRSPLAQSGPRGPASVLRVAAAMTGPTAAPTLSAAVAYEPAMVGAPAAS